MLFAVTPADPLTFVVVAMILTVVALLAAIAEELASHGYVVVGVNHTYESAVTVFADGRVVPMNPDAVAGVLGPRLARTRSGSASGRRSATTRPPIWPR